jgi:hypothetical protein
MGANKLYGGFFLPKFLVIKDMISCIEMFLNKGIMTFTLNSQPRQWQENVKE